MNQHQLHQKSSMRFTWHDFQDEYFSESTENEESFDLLGFQEVEKSS